MKKVLILCLLAVNVFAQGVKTPAPSPGQSIKQDFSLSSVEVKYSRPVIKGRKIFGDVVPFGKLWRTGANENTIVSFSDDVIIDGKTLKKGKYALYTVPKIESWEVIFYSTTDNWGTPQEFNEANVALRTVVKEEALSKPVETFTIGVSSLDPNYAYLEIYWENSYVAVKFEVPTQKTAIANIEKALAGPTSADYFAAAQFIFQSNGDNDKALEYVNKALDMSTEKPFWYNRLKSLIQAKSGNKAGAIESAKLSLAAAEAAKNQDYVKMNKDSIVEWSKK